MYMIFCFLETFETQSFRATRARASREKDVDPKSFNLLSNS